MLRALKFRSDTLATIAKESTAPIEDVQSQWENIVNNDASYYCVLGAQTWDGEGIQWVWMPESTLRQKFMFIGPEEQFSFSGIVLKHKK